jgi:hypothetical protein
MCVTVNVLDNVSLDSAAEHRPESDVVWRAPILDYSVYCSQLSA